MSLDHIVSVSENPLLEHELNNLQWIATDINSIKNLVHNSALGIKTLDLINVAMKGKGYKELFQNILTNRELHYFINSEEENIEKAFLDAKLRSFDIYWRKFAKGNTNAGRELS